MILIVPFLRKGSLLDQPIRKLSGINLDSSGDDSQAGSVNQEVGELDQSGDEHPEIEGVVETEDVIPPPSPIKHWSLSFFLTYQTNHLSRMFQI